MSRYRWGQDTDRNGVRRFWFGVVTFGMGLHIPEEEIETCRTLMEPAWIAVGLANDVFSWPKERDVSRSMGLDHVVNAVWVLMQEHSISEEEATRRCRELSAQCVAKYVETVYRVIEDESFSAGLRKYIEAMQYSISGNIVWSKTCPRYNPGAEFNREQLDWLANGVPELKKVPASMRCSVRPDFADCSNMARPGNGETDDRTDVRTCLLDCSLPPLPPKVNQSDQYTGHYFVANIEFERSFVLLLITLMGCLPRVQETCS